jgi:predicted dehydrogenase
MTIPKQVRVAIIGCGQIGTDWDYGISINSSPLTHAGAYYQHPRAELVALCDQDECKVNKAGAKWQVPYMYTDTKELFANHSIDVAVIATSTRTRTSVITPALDAGTRLLVIEKPLASTLGECRQLIAAMDALGAYSVVNFTRNWDPSILRVRDRIKRGEMGKMQRIVAYYGKGISNNGSHIIDLTRLLCNAYPVRARALNSPLDACEADWSTTGDQTMDAQIEFIDANNVSLNLTLLGTDHRNFTCFELRAIGQKAIFELTLGGRRLHWSAIQDDSHYSGYRVPGKHVALKARYPEAMRMLADEVVNLSLGKTTTVSCNAQTALRTALAIEAVRQSATKGGQWIKLDDLWENAL